MAAAAKYRHTNTPLPHSHYTQSSLPPPPPRPRPVIIVPDAYAHGGGGGAGPVYDPFRVPSLDCQFPSPAETTTTNKYREIVSLVVDLSFEIFFFSFSRFTGWQYAIEHGAAGLESTAGLVRGVSSFGLTLGTSREPYFVQSVRVLFIPMC